MRLAGVIDIQLLENASRIGNKTRLSGLDSSIKVDLKPTFPELNRWQQIKESTRRQMPNDIFTTRPLASTTLQYCINDVMYLPKLHACYMKRISP